MNQRFVQRNTHERRRNGIKQSLVLENGEMGMVYLSKGDNYNTNNLLSIQTLLILREEIVCVLRDLQMLTY